MVKWLVEEQHVSHSVINVNGHSALHKCAIYGHESVIDYLLEKIDTACLDAYLLPDDRNQAPSELARVNGFFELESKLRHIEDKTLKLPALFDASLALRATS
jgi:ankyrin repeat protein